jgi:hypothetical protein
MENTLELVESWVVFYGKFAYNGSWETETEAIAFAQSHPLGDSAAEVGRVVMYELR